MTLSQTITLSIIEGITEFLPVSSTGHLILTAQFLNLPQTNFVKDFEVTIQLAAILAVAVLYFETLVKNIKIWERILVAFVPAGLIGLILYKFIKNFLLGNTLITVLALFLGGFLLIVLEKNYQEQKEHLNNLEELNLTKAFLIGVIQSFSIIPGVSRSAATILGGLFLGLKRETAVEFSFLLAVPTLLAAAGFDLFKESHNFTPTDFNLLLIGFLVTFLTALLSVKFLIYFTKKHTLVPFGIYRMILALLFFLFVFLRT